MVGEKSEAVERPIWEKRGDEVTSEVIARFARAQTVSNSSDLRKVVELHREWVDSNGKAGLRISLDGDVGNSKTQLQGIGLSTANLDGAKIARSSLRRAVLVDSDMTDAALGGATIKRSTLIDADLRGHAFGPKSRSSAVSGQDEVAVRAAINVLRDSVESGKMPSGVPLDADAIGFHERAAERLEAWLKASRVPASELSHRRR